MNKAFVVAGLGFGDEGKGSIVDYLVRAHDADLVVRYNGGAQAAHNVVTPDGRHHTFSQFGAGMFVPGVRTHLSRFTILNPMSMVVEAGHLKELGIDDVWKRTTIDEKALIITPYQQGLNKLMEWSRGENRHGTCGQGIGQTRSDYLEYGDEVPFAGDLQDGGKLRRKLNFIRERCKEKLGKLDLSGVKDSADFRTQLAMFSDEALYWVDSFMELYMCCALPVVGSFRSYNSEVTVFEGAQGVLLDEKYGTAPHNTWTNCTYDNALTLLKEQGFTGRPERVGVMRSYLTRHGEGPFPTEDRNLTYPEPHNEDSGWQGRFRFGGLDWTLLRSSVRILGVVDWIAMNHMDQHYQSPVEVEEELNVAIGLLGNGPTAKDKIKVSTRDRLRNKGEQLCQEQK
jgi:adenylosuccinate synthase